MLSLIKNKFISLLQLLIVIVYILFEELIWEGIAKPIYEAIRSLKILQTIEKKLKDVNPTAILFIFVVLLVIVEAAGIYAGMLLISGQVGAGVLLYLSKIPIAAFTFWLFRVTEDKLMQFGWFKWLYKKMLQGIEWLKSRKMYINTMAYVKKMKASFKVWSADFKAKYFSKESLFLNKIKYFYKTVKESLKK